jgi:hypothetical protein
MRSSLSTTSFSLLITSLLALSSFTSALRLIESKSLNPCQDNSSFTASLFNVLFTPDNGSVSFNVIGVSSIAGFVKAEIEVEAYGYQIQRQVFDPCLQKGKGGKNEFEGLCPMSSGVIDLPVLRLL